MPDTLAKLFPTLPFAADADTFLRNFCKSVPEQLRERRILHFDTKPLISAGGISIGTDGNFIVTFCDMNTADENAETLGHEIGHTFHFDISQRPPQDRFDPATISEKLFDRVEEFCTELSKRWLALNGKESITRRIQNSMSLVHLYFVDE